MGLHSEESGKPNGPCPGALINAPNWGGGLAGTIGPTRTNGPGQEAHAPGRPGGGSGSQRDPMHASMHGDRRGPHRGPGGPKGPKPRQSLPGARHTFAHLPRISAPASRMAEEEEVARG